MTLLFDRQYSLNQSVTTLKLKATAVLIYLKKKKKNNFMFCVLMRHHKHLTKLFTFTFPELHELPFGFHTKQ